MEEIEERAYKAVPDMLRINGNYVASFVSGYCQGARYADSHPSDETIMRILNCIGYEEESWIGFVKKELERRK